MNNSVKRAHNFNAGPAALPLAVLKKAQAELLDFNDTGMSIMEHSHRGNAYEVVHNRAIELLKELLAIPEGYEVLFLQGGASLQFSMVPMNFLPANKKAGYVMTGVWSEKAYAEAEKLGEVFVAATAKEGNYCQIPALREINYDADTAYLHITSNNTIYGTQWHAFPNTEAVPLIADMSSDILSCPIDVSKFALIYAGAQKNIGPSGVTVVIIRRDFLEQAKKKGPTMLQYATFAKNNSLYNTPPTFGIYMMKLVLEWMKEEGGLLGIYKRNQEKAALIYDIIDASNGFYKGHAQLSARSLMNVTFRLADENLEKKFLEQAKQAGSVGLNGHRLVGGCRASIYNAVPYESCQALRDYMLAFQKENS